MLTRFLNFRRLPVNPRRNFHTYPYLRRLSVNPGRNFHTYPLDTTEPVDQYGVVARDTTEPVDQYGVIARITKDHKRFNGAGTLLISGLPIMLFSHGFGVAVAVPLNKIVGTLTNGSSNAFGYSAGSMENTPSRWDIEEASQKQLVGTALQKHLIEEYQKRRKPLDHNEVIFSIGDLQNAKLLVTNPLLVKSNEFTYFRDMVCAEHGINPRTLFYSQSDGKLFDISKTGNIKECSKDGEKDWEHLNIVKFNPQEYSMAEEIRKQQERERERTEEGARWRR
jgi:hypothetical protein